MDIATIVPWIFKLIDEMRYRRGFKRESLIKKNVETRAVLDDAYKLIDCFRRTVEEILKVIGRAYPDASIYVYRRESSPATMADLLTANRRLFEIASDMRLVTESLRKKLSRIGYEEVKSITDICLQIVNLEGMIGVQVANRVHDDILPVPFDKMTYWYLEERGAYPQLDTLPFETSDMAAYVTNMSIYFNALLLRLQDCKARLWYLVEDDLNSSREAPSA